MPHETTEPWNQGVRGVQVPPLINSNAKALRVQAGPGTGKTFGLLRRVVRVLHPRGFNAPPRTVLVCAFNRIIAKQLSNDIEAELSRDYVTSGVGTPLEKPVIKTVHGLCAELVGSRNRKLLPNEVETMIYDVLYRHPGLTTEFHDFRGALKAHREHEAGHTAHPALQQAAASWLADHGAELIGDAPREVERRIASGDFTDRKFDYVIADEFQDFTDAEAKVVVGLWSKEGSLMALGDRKQSIYAFRGNNPSGLQALQNLVDVEVENIGMDECQRCPMGIVNLANGVMALEDEPLRSAHASTGQLHNIIANTPNNEQAKLADEIVRVFQTKPHDKHLVLTTRRQWGYELRDKIKELDSSIPVRTLFSEDILETWPVREAFLLLSLIADGTDRIALREWLAYQTPSENRSYKAPKRNAPAYRSLLMQLPNPTADALITLDDAAIATISGTGQKNIKKRIARLKTLLSDITDPTDTRAVIEQVLDPDAWIASGDARAALARADFLRIKKEALEALQEESSLSDIVKLLRYKIAAREPFGEDEETPGIQIVTLWGAKGLTADYVYLAGLCDEALPGPDNSEEIGLNPGDRLDEQRRLLYVSLTRAKKSLVLSRPTKIRRGDIMGMNLIRTSRGDRYHQTLSDCRFFRDLPTGLLPDAVSVDVWSGVDL